MTAREKTNGLVADIETMKVAVPQRQRYIDIHCHCLPGLDDGPATMAESLSLCRGLAADGVTAVIATPHQLGRFSGRNDACLVRDRVMELNEQLKRNRISLEVFPGGDVRIDERICQLIEAESILTLADGGKYILLELPHEIFIDIDALLVDLSRLGITAIISHPERHPVVAKLSSTVRPVLMKWLAHSAHFQITCASLLGDFGVSAQKAAWEFLTSGWACFVATDAHDLEGRSPRMTTAYHKIRASLGEAAARQLCIENPLKILQGRQVSPTPYSKTRKWIYGKISTTS